MMEYILLAIIIIVVIILVWWWASKTEGFATTDEIKASSKTGQNIVDTKINFILNFMRNIMKTSQNADKVKYDALEAAKIAVEADLASSEASVASLTTQRDELQSKLDVLKASSTASQTEVSNLINEIEAIDKTIDLLVSALKEHKSIVSQMACIGDENNIIRTVKVNAPTCWEDCANHSGCEYATHNNTNDSCTIYTGVPLSCTFNSEDSMFIKDSTISDLDNYNGIAGWNFPSNDIPGNEFEMGLSARECSKKCSEISGCNGTSYDANIKKCWFKNKLVGGVQNNHATTQIMPGYNIPKEGNNEYVKFASENSWAPQPV